MTRINLRVMRAKNSCMTCKFDILSIKRFTGHVTLYPIYSSTKQILMPNNRRQHVTTAFESGLVLHVSNNIVSCKQFNRTLHALPARCKCYKCTLVRSMSIVTYGRKWSFLAERFQHYVLH